MNRYAPFFFTWVLLAFVSCGVAYGEVSMTSPLAEYDHSTGAGKKLGRGAANVLFGWLDLFKGIQEVNDNNNVIAAVTWGPIYGAGKAITRTAAGAAEIVTFPIAAPANFAPLVEPEFVLDDYE